MDNNIDLQTAKEALTATEYAILNQLYNKIKDYEAEQQLKVKQKDVTNFFKDHLSKLGYQVIDFNNQNGSNFVDLLISNVQQNLPIFEQEPVIEDENSIDYQVAEFKHKGYSDLEISRIIYSADQLGIPIASYLKSFK